MIPSIEDILKMLLNKECTLAQAMAWIDTHMILAVGKVDLQDLRDMFAAKAMQGEMSTRFNWRLHFREMAQNCYVMVDAMLKARESNIKE